MAYKVVVVQYVCKNSMHIELFQFSVFRLLTMYVPIIQTDVKTQRSTHLLLEVTEQTRTYPWMSIEWDWQKIEYSSYRQKGQNIITWSHTYKAVA